MGEEWRNIPGWDGYQASSLGRVRSMDRVRAQKMPCGTVHLVRYPGKVLKQSRCPDTGYMKVGLANPGLKKGRRTVSVHTIVCRTFHGERPHRLDAGHWNGIRSDNREDNLRWCTRKENLADRIRHGTLNSGDRNGMSRVSRERRAQLEGAL